MNWGIVGVIVSILMLAGAVIVHLVRTTYLWATFSTTVNLSLTSINETLKKIDDRLTSHEKEGIIKEQYYRDKTAIELNLKANWDKYELLRTKVEEMEKDCAMRHGNDTRGNV